jgi:hypothetical protein
MTGQPPQQSIPPTYQTNTTTPTLPPNSINVNALGYFLDGWADIVEGMGDKVETVRANVLNELHNREMPEIQVNKMTGVVSLTSNQRRPYLITTTAPGATTAINISKHGKDLFASWKTFIRPVLNQKVIFITLGICAFLGLITGGVDSGGMFGGGPSFSFGGWISSTILFLILAAAILGFGGRIFKGSFLAFFFVEPNLFDADDITAMSLSTHKSILRALDGAGIDVSKLRLKQDFKGGRRDEVV